jgi:hypothetical protein
MVQDQSISSSSNETSGSEVKAQSSTLNAAPKVGKRLGNEALESARFTAQFMAQLTAGLAAGLYRRTRRR